MQIILYKNRIPLNHISRSLADALTITGEPHDADNLDILNPEITLKYNATYLQYNYCYIPDFGRYYSFSAPPTITKKTITLHLHVDVLYTYRSVIMQSQCIAERSSSNYELMAEDGAVTALAGYELFSRSLPYSFRPDAGTYVLTVAGG
jgi:hypothetical protein